MRRREMTTTDELLEHDEKIGTSVVDLEANPNHEAAEGTRANEPAVNSTVVELEQSPPPSATGRAETEKDDGPHSPIEVPLAKEHGELVRLERRESRSLTLLAALGVYYLL